MGSLLAGGLERGVKGGNERGKVVGPQALIKPYSLYIYIHISIYVYIYLDRHIYIYMWIYSSRRLQGPIAHSLDQTLPN